MRASIVALFLLLASTALSGCVEDSTLGAAHAAPAARAAAAAPADDAPSGAWSDTVDLLPYLREDRVALVAFRATEDLTLNVRMDKEVTHPGGTTCSLGSLRPHAPVDHLLAVAAGHAGYPPPYTPHGTESTGSASDELLLVTVGGRQVLHGDDAGLRPAPQGSTARADASMSLAEGEWLLVTAGLYGVGPDELEADSKWTLKLTATAALERRGLPSARLACGLGFDEHAETRLGPVSVDPSASAAWTGDYAANLRVQSSGGEADGHFLFDQQRIPLARNMDVHRFAWGNVEAGFEVADPGESSVVWVFQGV